MKNRDKSRLIQIKLIFLKIYDITPNKDSSLFGVIFDKMHVSRRVAESQKHVKLLE